MASMISFLPNSYIALSMGISICVSLKLLWENAIVKMIESEGYYTHAPTHIHAHTKKKRWRKIGSYLASSVNECFNELVSQEILAVLAEKY